MKLGKRKEDEEVLGEVEVRDVLSDRRWGKCVIQGQICSAPRTGCSYQGSEGCQGNEQGG